jgi:two-component system, NarL family, invasion response regulator UvrY
MTHGSATTITVLLVDDHAVVREGYRRLLESRNGIRVVSEAANASEALEQFSAAAPDVVVMDIALPGGSGIEALRRMRVANPEARVLMFSMYEDAIYATRAMQCGACGYVTKASAPGVLVAAVESVAAGRKYISPDIAQELALRSITADADAPGRLSVREVEVLRLLVQGLPTREIAETMGLTPKTVANHQSAIKQKLGAETSIQLARIGTQILRYPEGSD